MATLAYPPESLPDFSQTFGPMSNAHYHYSNQTFLLSETEATFQDLQSCTDLASVIGESMQPVGSYGEANFSHPDYQIIGTSQGRYMDETCIPMTCPEMTSGTAEIFKCLDMLSNSNVEDDDDRSVVFDFEDLSFLDSVTQECNSDGEHSCNSSTRDDTYSPDSLDSQDYPNMIPDLDYLCHKPKFSFEEESEDEEFEKPYCKSRRGAKNVLLWKFILQVLEARPDLAKWVNRKEGTFKFVDTTVMSRMWGEKKRKRDMTFEKLSRGIRHYYKSGLMSRIEGTRLVYKFNWHQVPKPFRKN